MTAAGLWRGRLLPSRLEAAEQPAPVVEAGVGMADSSLPVPSRAAPLLGTLGRAGAAAVLLVCRALGWMPQGRVPAPGSTPEEENLGHRSSLGTSTSDAAKGNKLA